MGNPVKVLLVDDHHLFLMGIDSILRDQPGIEVVGHAGNGEEAVEKVKKLNPDVVLMDINMPVCNGIEATRIIKGMVPQTAILMLTVNDGDEELFEAIKAGAQGYLLKNLTPDELLACIHNASRGEVTISGQIAGKIFQYFRSHNMNPERNEKVKEQTDHILTAREIEILQQVIRGLTNKEIADQLCISENTVKNHLRNIMEKLHLQNRVQAAAYALNIGLITLD
ncbi:response regulator [Effusibacillus lacus]|uniref:DNA-binding response regulator n=1 Tax=Effusibacillus lacus TaxID=1348429 RepID=A0A292YSB6_9BACL|nr:response regulator transcription factor [Effusibacillus lacus]TCS76133.1 LuxR family two component transcriptional regulator [Effusibacillus lacus]GAX91360.1 DNA-binding response regulator [Effusibacillus lacus]